MDGVSMGRIRKKCVFCEAELEEVVMGDIVTSFVCPLCGAEHTLSGKSAFDY